MTSCKNLALILSLSATISVINAAQLPAQLPAPTATPVNNDVLYVGSVLSAIQNSQTNSIGDAFTNGKAVTASQGSSGALVCLQNAPTTSFLRSHSTNPAANGIVTLANDVAGFIELHSLAAGDGFVLSLPSDANNPNSAPTPFPGKIAYKGPDGYCIARYVQSAAPADADYPATVLTFSFQQNSNIQQAYRFASRITPSPSGAVVCIQNTPQGLYRTHSTNPAATGIVTLKQDIDAFTSLIGKPRGNSFTLNIPANADGTGAITPFIGNVIYSGKDGFCIARYIKS